MTEVTKEDKNYVAAWVDYQAEKIIVLERDSKGTLFRKRYNPPYYFYVPDEEGEHTSLFDDKLCKVEFGTKEEYDFAKRHFPVKFESDIAPLKRVLMDNYYGRPAPPINYALFDIEVDTKKALGWADAKNPYAPINAVTVYQSWTGRYKIAALPPPGWEGNEAAVLKSIQDLVQVPLDKIDLRLCRDELELLNLLVDWLSSADIFSGWNSDFFDVPYLCERLLMAGGERLLLKLEHLGARAPKKELVNNFGEEKPIYRFSGKSHLDYMKLFKKFTFEGRTSYSLGNILEEEIGVGKLSFDGHFEDFYNKEFPKFISYNLRDVSGLVDLDKKFKFILTANQMAHESTVVFDSVLGTVAFVETAVINHAHYKFNRVIPDKVIKDNDKIEGAIVLTPTPGLYPWMGSVDLKSLYPNTVRSINISPEMIVGEFTANEVAWAEIRKGSDVRLTFIQESGEQHVATALEWKKVLKKNNWAISGYGTVFDQGRGRGVIPDILGLWYSERLQLQDKMEQAQKKSIELVNTTGIQLDPEQLAFLSSS